MLGMGRVKLRTSWALSTALAVAFGSFAIVPTAAAHPLPLAAKKKPKKKPAPKPGLSPDDAETKRQAIRDAVQSDREAGDLDAVARGLEDNGALLGDPVVLLEAGEARLELAERERDVAEAERAIETTSVALDIAHFYVDVQAGKAHSDWQVIEPRRASGLVSDAERQIERARSIIERIEREELGEDASSEPGPIAAKTSDKKKRERKPMRPGTGLIIAGATFTAIGATGAGLGIAGLAIGASKQREVESKTIPEEQDEVERLDAEGGRANRMGYAGVGVAAGALVIGIPLLVVGVIKRKRSGDAPATARVRVSPVFAGHHNGLLLSGSF
jgi:hypothetical protein